MPEILHLLAPFVKVGWRPVLFRPPQGLASLAVNTRQPRTDDRPSMVADSPARCALLRFLERLSLRHKQLRFLARTGALALQCAPESVCRNCAGDCTESPHYQIQAVQQYLAIADPGQGTCGITQRCVLANIYAASEYRSQQAQCRASLFQLLACLVNTFIGD